MISNDKPTLKAQTHRPAAKSRSRVDVAKSSAAPKRRAPKVLVSGQGCIDRAGRAPGQQDRQSDRTPEAAGRSDLQSPHEGNRMAGALSARLSIGHHQQKYGADRYVPERR
jgi:hypothetical protein